MDIFVGIDASLTNTGIVVMDKTGIVTFSETIRTKPHGKSRSGLFERWEYIADQAQLSLSDNIPMGPHAKCLIYAPHYQHGKNKNATTLPCVNGIMYGLCRGLTVNVIWRDDLGVRNALRQAGYAVPKDKSGIKPFVKQYFEECPNEHEAMAWLAAKYLSVTN